MTEDPGRKRFMSEYFALSPGEEDGLLGSLNGLCRKLLEAGAVDAALVPQRLPHGSMVQHILVQDSGMLRGVDPVAPVLPVNGAVLAARLTRQDPGGKVGALLRPCELRAFFELVKLQQGDRHRVLLVGIDCMGTFEPPLYQGWATDDPDTSVAFLKAMLTSHTPPEGAPSLRRCCQACEFPTPEGADIQVLLVGSGSEGPYLLGATDRGEACLNDLGLSKVGAPESRTQAVDALVQRRIASRDRLFEEVESDLLPVDRLLGELSACINCYNCREVCPVCYCKTCVFEGHTFEHPAAQYLRWAKRKGAIKMPTDTLFYHVTRMAHMSTSCVGCGQCTSACPMGIRVAEIFRTVSRRTQGVFDYVPGRDVEEPLPLATFREEELMPR
jgi:formate dehydrogenase subunit beta